MTLGFTTADENGAEDSCRSYGPWGDHDPGPRPDGRGYCMPALSGLNGREMSIVSISSEHDHKRQGLSLADARATA